VLYVLLCAAQTLQSDRPKRDRHHDHHQLDLVDNNIITFYNNIYNSVSVNKIIVNANTIHSFIRFVRSFVACPPCLWRCGGLACLIILIVIIVFALRRRKAEAEVDLPPAGGTIVDVHTPTPAESEYARVTLPQDNYERGSVDWN
jgi:hypothetical protein